MQQCSFLQIEQQGGTRSHLCEGDILDESDYGSPETIYFPGQVSWNLLYLDLFHAAIDWKNKPKKFETTLNNFSANKILNLLKFFSSIEWKQTYLLMLQKYSQRSPNHSTTKKTHLFVIEKK